jgi:NAD(P)H-dependent flavin oxidoreductase YrpB (nitropropane dioxygenase family)
MGPDMTGPELVGAVSNAGGLGILQAQFCSPPGIDVMALLAGQGVGLVHEIKPAAQIVHELVEEARQIIAQRLLGLVQPAFRKDEG